MLGLNILYTYLKNNFFLKIIFILAIFFFSNASIVDFSKKSKCDFNLFKYKDEIEKISNIKLIEIKNTNYRKWTIEGMRIYLNSYRDAGFIEDKYKKFHKADLIIHYDFGKCKFKSKIRQNGDLFDHIKFENSHFRRSLDIKILDGNLSGITKFKLFNPESRENDNEIFMTELLRKFNILSPKTQKITVNVNGVQNIYLFQEKIVKEFLESNLRREAPIFEGSEEFLWNKDTNDIWEKISLISLDNPNFIKNDYDKLDMVLNSYNSLQKIYLEYVTSIFPNYGESIVLNIDKLSNNSKELKKKWIIFELLMISSNSGHGLRPHNRKFYWNSLDDGFEPIYYDGSPLINNDKLFYVDNHVFSYLKKFVKKNDIKSMIQQIRKIDKKEFYKNLNIRGANLSEKEINIFFNQIINKLISIDTKIKNNKKIEDYKFNFKHLNKYKKTLESLNLKLNVKSILKTDKKSQSYIVEECLSNCNLENREISYISDLIKDSKLVNRSILYLDYLIDNQNIIKHNIEINSNKIEIFTTANLKINILDKNIIELSQSNNSDWALIKNSELNDIKIIFNGSKNGLKNIGLNEKNITNCLTFYKVNFKNVNLFAENNFCEDAINIINSKGEIDSIKINNSQFDALDVDFSDIKIKNIEIKNAQNDCIDFSQGNYILNNVDAHKCGDKAVSVGENSKMKIDKLKVNSTYYGIASKDSSLTMVSNSNIVNSKYCLTAYNKKNEFNGGYLKIKNNICKNFSILQNKDNLSIIEVN